MMLNGFRINATSVLCQGYHKRLWLYHMLIVGSNNYIIKAAKRMLISST